ncbi:uncharacterized protein BYT42DRAFT_560990 [Radiomyces spectabilis]|uniref:uncharacterized protein n=1 Tax=Radiomyces spectabilis TaxID=64574 RepID=UPI00221EE73D|nr:uncharacterized protein BYT42DRAFT_560990 [Radiomyces spectabilis]KAI8388718.1 hypothetical protein BYT42DRAFT_560990 [Radiomyces spectabilis]
MPASILEQSNTTQECELHPSFGKTGNASVSAGSPPNNEPAVKEALSRSMNDEECNDPATQDNTAVSSIVDVLENLHLDDVPLTLDPIYESNISAEMLMLFEELLPSRESYDRRMGLVYKIDRLLNMEWPGRGIKVHLFGSSVNDLGTSQSDVDLCITTQWNGLRNIRTLARLFRHHGMQHVVCVPRAKVPIVRLFDPESQLACDINVNNTLALQNTDMIKAYVAIDPRVRPLAMIIKQWTKQRILNDAANGGTLSTYTWTCMLINFLQMRQPPILPVLHQLNIADDPPNEHPFYRHIGKLQGFGKANHESLGGLLFAFFRRFAIEFDYDEQVVSVRHGCYLSKQEKGWNTGRNLSFCVEEPFNVSRNLGNSADITSVTGLRLEFRRAMDMMLASEPLNVLCEPYEFLSFDTSTPVPIIDNRRMSFTELHTLHHPLAPTYLSSIHPHLHDFHHHDRRNSMVEGIYPHPETIPLLDINAHLDLPDQPQPPSSSALHPYSSERMHSHFQPRYSSPQTLHTITQMRNMRHGSHPSLVPSPMFFLLQPHRKKNMKERTMDGIFARYNRRPSFQERRRRHSSLSVNGAMPSSSHASGANYRHDKSSVASSRTPRRRSSALVDWPSISTQPAPSQHWDGAAQRRRRWSTAKSSNAVGTPERSSAMHGRIIEDAEIPKRTMADIVRVGVHPISPISSSTPQIEKKNVPKEKSQRTRPLRQKSSSHHNNNKKKPKGSTDKRQKPRYRLSPSS